MRGLAAGAPLSSPELRKLIQGHKKAPGGRAVFADAFLLPVCALYDFEMMFCCCGEVGGKRRLQFHFSLSQLHWLTNAVVYLVIC